MKNTTGEERRWTGRTNIKKEDKEKKGEAHIRTGEKKKENGQAKQIISNENKEKEERHI